MFIGGIIINPITIIVSLVGGGIYNLVKAILRGFSAIAKTEAWRKTQEQKKRETQDIELLHRKMKEEEEREKERQYIDRIARAAAHEALKKHKIDSLRAQERAQEAASQRSRELMEQFQNIQKNFFQRAPNYNDGIKFQLSEEEVSEAHALAYSFGFPDYKLTDLYRFRSPHPQYYDVGGYILTKFCRLVILTRQSITMPYAINQAYIDKFLRSSTLAVAIVTYSGSPPLTENSHIVLIQRSKTIQPVTIYFPTEWGFFSLLEVGPHDVLSFPNDKCVILGDFAYADIDAKAKTKIILVLPKGQITFEVDFSRYK